MSDVREIRHQEKTESEKNEIKERANKVAKHIESYLSKNDFRYFVNEIDLTYVVGIEANDSSFNIIIRIEPEAESVGLSTTLFKCPGNYLTPMCKLLMKINRNLRYGNFYISSQGDIIFRINFPLVNHELSDELFERSIFSVVVAVDTNYRTIAEALFGKFSEEDKREWLIEIREFIELLS